MWWLNVMVALLFVVGIYAFLVLTGFNTKFLSRRTSRRAEDLYPRFRNNQPPDDPAQEGDRQEPD
jgi:hypothetical protein